MGATPTLTQVGYAFVNDDGNEANSTLYSQNTLQDFDVSSGNVKKRVRLEVQCTGNNYTDGYYLYVSRNSGAYSRVTTTSSYVKISTSTYESDGTATTDRLTSGTGTFEGGEWDSNGVIGSYTISKNSHGENEFCIEFISADLSDNDSLDFRIYNDDGTAINGGYTVTAQSTITKTAQTATIDPGVSTLGGFNQSATLAAIVTITAAVSVFGGFLQNATAETHVQSTVTSNLGGFSQSSTVTHLSIAEAIQTLGPIAQEADVGVRIEIDGESSISAISQELNADILIGLAATSDLGGLSQVGSIGGVPVLESDVISDLGGLFQESSTQALVSLSAINDLGSFSQASEADSPIQLDGISELGGISQNANSDVVLLSDAISVLIAFEQYAVASSGSIATADTNSIIGPFSQAAETVYWPFRINATTGAINIDSPEHLAVDQTWQITVKVTDDLGQTDTGIITVNLLQGAGLANAVSVMGPMEQSASIESISVADTTSVFGSPVQEGSLSGSHIAEVVSILSPFAQSGELESTVAASAISEFAIAQVADAGVVVVAESTSILNPLEQSATSGQSIQSVVVSSLGGIAQSLDASLVVTVESISELSIFGQSASVDNPIQVVSTSDLGGLFQESSTQVIVQSGTISDLGSFEQYATVGQANQAFGISNLGGMEQSVAVQNLVQIQTVSSLAGLAQSSTGALEVELTAISSLAAVSQAGNLSKVISMDGSSSLSSLEQAAAVDSSIRAECISSLVAFSQDLVATVDLEAFGVSNLGAISQLATSGMAAQASINSSLGSIVQEAQLVGVHNASASSAINSISQVADLSSVVGLVGQSAIGSFEQSASADRVFVAEASSEFQISQEGSIDADQRVVNITSIIGPFVQYGTSGQSIQGYASSILRTFSQIAYSEVYWVEIEIEPWQHTEATPINKLVSYSIQNVTEAPLLEGMFRWEHSIGDTTSIIGYTSVKGASSFVQEADAGVGIESEVISTFKKWSQSADVLLVSNTAIDSILSGFFQSGSLEEFLNVSVVQELSIAQDSGVSVELNISSDSVLSGISQEALSLKVLKINAISNLGRFYQTADVGAHRWINTISILGGFFQNADSVVFYVADAGSILSGFVQSLSSTSHRDVTGASTLAMSQSSEVGLITDTSANSILIGREIYVDGIKQWLIVEVGLESSISQVMGGFAQGSDVSVFTPCYVESELGGMGQSGSIDLEIRTAVFQSIRKFEQYATAGQANQAYINSVLGGLNQSLTTVTWMESSIESILEIAQEADLGVEVVGSSVGIFNPLEQSAELVVNLSVANIESVLNPVGQSASVEHIFGAAAVSVFPGAMEQNANCSQWINNSIVSSLGSLGQEADSSLVIQLDSFSILGGISQYATSGNAIQFFGISKIGPISQNADSNLGDLGASANSIISISQIADANLDGGPLSILIHTYFYDVIT